MQGTDSKRNVPLRFGYSGSRKLSKRLFKSTASVGQITLVSRCLGYVRDVVIANYFGASTAADAFFVAFRIPNFFRRLFAEGAFSQAFVPVLTEYKTQQTFAETQELVDRVAGTLGTVLVAVTAVCVLSAPLFVMAFAPGFIGDAEKFELTVRMLRMTFPYLLLISLAALAGGILNSYGRFAVPAFTPVFLNLSLIAAAIWVAPQMAQPVEALAWGVLLGGFLQLGFQLPFLLRLRLLPKPRTSQGHEGVRRILRLMVPAIFGVSISQLNLMLDTIIASFLVTGSVSWLYYSDRLVEFPLGVFGIALATVILPGLSEQHARGRGFSRTLNWALRWVVVIGLPAATGLAVLAGPLMCTLFQYGALSGHDVDMAARSLTAYAFGLVGFTLIKVLAPGYFARQDTRTPVRIGIIAMLFNMVMNLILVFPLAHAGLALATSLAAFLNAGMLFRGLRKAGVLLPDPARWRVLGQASLACLIMTGVLHWLAPGLEQWLAWSAVKRVSQLLLCVGGGILTYGLVLWLTGVRLNQLIAADAE